MTQDEKLALVRYLIFLRGKLQSLAIELLMLGESPAKVDDAEEKLAKQISIFRVAMMQTWQGNAATLMGDLRSINERAQRQLRELKQTQDRAAKIANILGLIDRGLVAVARLV